MTRTQTHFSTRRAEQLAKVVDAARAGRDLSSFRSIAEVCDCRQAYPVGYVSGSPDGTPDGDLRCEECGGTIPGTRWYR
jgi:hypothetical protein